MMMVLAPNVLPQTPVLSGSSNQSPPALPSEGPRTVAQALPLSGSEQVNPYALYTGEPAPMGIADYGIGPGGAYQYSTSSFLGVAYVASLSTSNSSGFTSMSIQLNADLKFTVNGTQYVYWVQDVAQIDTATSTINFLDNIWNHSGASQDMGSVALSGNGNITQEDPDPRYFYYCWASSSLAGNGVSLSYPVDIEFRVNSTIGSSGHPQVTFEYSDGFGWQEYDVVVFSANGTTSLAGFVVDGTSYNPFNVFYDAELILGGAYGGESTQLISSDVRLQLEYWNGHNYQMIENAYNFGSDTAECIQNALSKWYYYPSRGELIAEVQPGGGGTLGKLWDLSESGIGTIDITTIYDSGILYVRNASVVGGTSSAYPFTGGEVTVTLEPGYYHLSMSENGYLVDEGNYSLARGQQLQLSELVSLTVSYSIVGGGSGYSPPKITYRSHGQVQTTSLSASPVVLSLDSGSSWNVSAALSGSSASERWQANQALGGTAVVIQQMVFAYYHQFNASFSYSVAGGGSGYSSPVVNYTQFGAILFAAVGSNVWVDAGSYCVYPQVLQGSGQQERWASPSQTAVVSGPGSVLMTYSHQFLLAISGVPLNSQWYDAGSTATVSFSTVYGRAGGSGERVTSYSVDGSVSAIQPTAGNVTASIQMSTTHLLSVNSVLQYQVSLGAGAGALVSITPPTITGDSGWYDSGTEVTIIFNSSWNQTVVGSRLNVVGFSVDQGAATALTRSGNGTFPLQLSMIAPHTVGLASVVQYSLAISGGKDVVVSQISPTGDSYYDEGSTLTVTTDYTWSIMDGNTRQNLLSFALDGLTTNVTRAESGNFTTPAVTLDGAHVLTFTSITQCLVSFRFQDNAGAREITPASLQVGSGGPNIVNVPQSGLWVDNGSVVQVYSVIWENSDVKPTSQNSFSVDSPLLETIRCRVYDAGLKVTDYLGFPVSGAQVSVDLANGSNVKATTGGDGNAAFGLIPLGAFKATVSSLGTTTTVSGDASVQSATDAKVVGSYVTFGLIAGVALLAVVVSLLVIRSHHNRRVQP